MNLTLVQLDDLIARAEGADDRGDYLLDRDLHKLFKMRGDRPFRYSRRIESTIELIERAQPTWGYRLDRGPAPTRRDFYTASVFIPAEDPDAPLRDPRGWGRARDGSGPTLPLAALRAFLRALKASLEPRE